MIPLKFKLYPQNKDTDSVYISTHTPPPSSHTHEPLTGFLNTEFLVPRPVSQAAGARQVWDKARTHCTHAGVTIVWQNYFQMVSFSYSDENIYVSYKTVRYMIIFR